MCNSLALRLDSDLDRRNVLLLPLGSWDSRACM